MRPEVQSVTEDFYAALAPLTNPDEENNWALLKFLDALATMFQEIEGYARDTFDGHPGWSILLDLDRVPDIAIPWLAQFIGVTIPPGISVDAAKDLIRNAQGFKRGTLGAIAAAPRPFLTGGKSVVVRERADTAYSFEVITYEPETPDADMVLQALRREKNAGLLMEYIVSPGQTYSDLNATNASYGAVDLKYSSYEMLRMDIPDTSRNYKTLRAENATYQAAKTAYPTYDLMFLQ